MSAVRMVRYCGWSPIALSTCRNKLRRYLTRFLRHRRRLLRLASGRDKPCKRPPGTGRGPFVVWVGGSSAADVGALDLAQELDVGLGGAHLVDHQLERLGGLEGAEHAAELPGHHQLLVAEQQLLLTGRGGVDVEGGEDAALGQLAVQPNLHVPGALELLEDDLVHARAGVHQRGREDRQRAAVLDISGRAEEALGRVERRGVDAAGEDLAARGGGEVVGTRQAGDAVQQDHHVLAVLDQALGPLDGQLGDLAVVVAGPVEGRGDHLRPGRALHVGDLFRPLADQQDDQDHLGIVDADRVGDLLHQGGLARLGRGHDQPALALADRAHDVHDPGRDLRRGVLEPETLVGVQRGEVFEVLAVARGIGLHPVDLVAAAQRHAPDHRQRHVDVVGTRQEAVDPQEAVPVLGADVERASAGDLGPVVGRAAALTAIGSVEDRHAALVAAVAVAAAAVAVAPPATALLLAGLVVPATAALLGAVPVTALAALAALLALLARRLLPFGGQAAELADLTHLAIAAAGLAGLTALPLPCASAALRGGAVGRGLTAGGRLGPLLCRLARGLRGRGRAGLPGLVAGTGRLAGGAGAGAGGRPRLGLPRGRVRRGTARCRPGGHLLGTAPGLLARGPAVAVAGLNGGAGLTGVRARAGRLRARPVGDGRLGDHRAGAACSAPAGALRAVRAVGRVAAWQRLLPGRSHGRSRGTGCRAAPTTTAGSRRRNELDTLGLGDDGADEVGLAQTLVTLDTH